jgi:hypothetical protein
MRRPGALRLVSAALAALLLSAGCGARPVSAPPGSPTSPPARTAASAPQASRPHRAQPPQVLPPSDGSQPSQGSEPSPSPPQTSQDAQPPQPAQLQASQGSVHAVHVATISPAQAQGAPQTPPPPAGPQPQPVGLAQNGQTIRLTVGETIILDLGSATSVRDGAPGVLAPAGPAPSGTGTLYRALAPGTAVLTAAVVPACRWTRPACEVADRLFRITAVVSPA